MRLRLLTPILVGLAVGSCSSMPGGLPDLGSVNTFGVAEKAQTAAAPASDQHYIQQVMELRKRSSGGSDTRVLLELRRVENEAATHYLAAGSALAREQRYQEAIEKFELGLIAQPSNAELQHARQKAAERKEVGRLYAEGQRAKLVGNFDLAETLFQKAASIDGQNIELKKELTDLDRSKKNERERYVLAAFRSPAPVAVNFRDAKLKDALKVLCDPYNLNFVFDKNADNLDVNVSAKNVTFEQAFNMILQSSNTAYKVLGPNSVFIYENTPDKKKQYADRYFKTFHLSTLKAERMAEILKSSMDIKTLVANNDLGTIQVRDTRETLEVVERLIATNDRKPAEIMLDVEILEVDRNKADQLGIDYGSQIAVQTPQFKIGDLFGGGASSVLNEGLITVPAVTLSYLKSDVSARTLSNPRVRTVDGQPAKIHVGDRVPLQSASIQDATGQSRTMYEYHDIGIRLNVIPKYHLDDTIFVDLSIEVSSLGQNLGTPLQPAYAIGTRNVHTTMILRESETAVLGGLISDEERHSLNRVPGLGDNSIIGRLFSSNTDSAARTELLLTITPHLVRSQSLPRRSNTDFFSGTENDYSTRSNYDYLNRPSISEHPPKYFINPDNKRNTQTRVRAAPEEKAAGGFQTTVIGR